MKKHNGLATKLISVVASVALVIGLMPLPAFAVSGDENAGDSTPNETTLLTAGVVFGEEAPLTAGAPDNKAETASEDTWDWVHKKIENAKDGDTITLKANTVYKAGPNDNVLEVKKSIKIDLNGSTLNRNLTERKDNGHVIEVSHNATLSILDKAGGGKITGGFSAYGGGIYVYSGSKLELQSGTITGNKAKTAGGGIYAGGTVEIKGGTIDNNISYGKGGGIYVCSDGDSSVSNAAITRNIADSDGGGVYMDAEKHKLTITDTGIDQNTTSGDGGGIFLYWGTIDMNQSDSGHSCSLSSNTAKNNGGGAKITSKTSFTAKGVTISDNKAEKKVGGGVANYGTTTLSNCIIRGNTSSKEGGGVFNDKDGESAGDLTLENCTISGNESKSGNGGGVYSNKKLAINGGTIGTTGDEGSIPNQAGNNIGHGVYIGGSSDPTEIKGAIVVKGNGTKNGKQEVFLGSGRVFKVTGALSAHGNNSCIGVTVQDPKHSAGTAGTGIITEDYEKDNKGVDPSTYFFSPEEFNIDWYENKKNDNDGSDNAKDGKEVQIASAWGDLQTKIKNTPDGETIDLKQNYTASREDGPLIIPAQKKLTINLNGHTLNRNLPHNVGSGHVIEVAEGKSGNETTLTIKDEVGGGTITGGHSDEGGGIHIHKYATLNFESGTITGNHANKDGGGIYVDGTLKTSGGTIQKNYADETGGGIYVTSTGAINLNGTTITDNTSKKGGAGINAHLRKDTSSSIANCSITHNTTSDNGGGLRLYADGSKLKINDTTFENNVADNGGGIFLYYGEIEMNGGFLHDNTAEVGGGIDVTHGTTFTANGVTINENKATDNGGGGVMNCGTTSLTDCIISGNTADGKGGGIYNANGCALSTKNCTIADNKSNSDGGGIYSDHDFTIDGTIEEGQAEQCIISGNTAQGKGGGIFIDKGPYSILIKGCIKIKNNTASIGKDIYLRDYDRLELSGKITGTDVGSIDMEDFGVFTIRYGTGDGGFYAMKDSKGNIIQENLPSNFFNTDPGAYPVHWQEGEYEGDEAELRTDWPDLKKAIENAPNNKEITLDKDYIACYYDKALTISGNKTIIINLAGHTLNRNLSSKADNGHIFEVTKGSTLIIKDEKPDNSTSEKGVITGGFSGFGGGIFVHEGATLDFRGGTIKGNNASNDGGGIYVNGTLKMSGGTIEGNYAGETGGGIFVDSSGAIEITHVTIAGNTTGGKGAGLNVHLRKGYESSITNCLITGNEAKDCGGGLRLDAKGETLKIIDTRIEGNSSCDGGGIYLCEGTVEMSSSTSDYSSSISDNVSSNDAGGVKVTKGTTFKATGVIISSNQAATEEGGGIKNYSTATLTNCIIRGNNAQKEGGGVYNANHDGSNAEITLDNCTISGNTSEKNGGGVYSNHVVTIKGGSISENSAQEGAGLFVDKSAKYTYIEGEPVVTNNTAAVFGNDAFLRSGKMLTQKNELTGKATIGVDLEDGVGVFTDGYADHNKSGEPKDIFVVAKGYSVKRNDKGEAEITSSWKTLKDHIENLDSGSTYVLDEDYAAKPSDDRILIQNNKNITIDLNGHTLNRYRIDKTKNGQVLGVLGGSTLTIKDGSAKDGKQGTGRITGGYSELGGGIFVDANAVLNLEAGTITGNRADSHGAGIYVGGTLNMEGGAIESNTATNSGEGVLVDSSGGGIYVGENGELNLKGGTISGNVTSSKGGGIMPERTAKVSVEGNPVVQSNSATIAGGDIYLFSGSVLNVTDALGEQARISVSLENEWGEFTSGYGSCNSGKDPGLYFASADGYAVYLENDEATLKADTHGETEYEKPFIDRNNQVNTNTASLGSQNWLSGISGERYLNEINMPGSHDSGMEEVEVLPGLLDVTSAAAFFDYYAGETFAQTQTLYIDQQLDAGARQLDIRLIDCHKDVVWYEALKYDWVDDGRNLWICHGTSTSSGTYLAGGHDGKTLSFDTVLDWVKDFLEKHPTETVVLNIRPETPYSSHHMTIWERTKTILETSTLEINRSTGEPFLYKEDDSDDYFAAYTHMPQLKDCRGKIVLLPNTDEFVGIVGGFQKDTFVKDYEAPSSYRDTGSEKVDEVEAAYRSMNGDGSKKIPTEAGVASDSLWYWELNCTGEDQGDLKYFVSGKSPVDYAAYVNPRLIGGDKLFGPDLTGEYIGWVRLDAFEAKYAEPIWRTNFPDFQYCTITVESGLGDPYVQQTWRVLKGTEITIPGNIYKKLPKDKCLSSWEAKSQHADTTCYPGRTFKVDEDVTFTAEWVADGQIPVRIEWKDANNADILRTDSVNLDIYENDKNTSQITLTDKEGWSGLVVAETTNIVPNCDLVIPTKDKPNGQDTVGQYRYEAKHDEGSGFVLTFYHTPQDTVNAMGGITWDDNKDVDGLRPAVATISLRVNGVAQATMEATESSGWEFDFRTLPQYKDGVPQYENGEKIEYSIAEEGIAGYSVDIQGFSVINTHVPQDKNHVNVIGAVEWNDADNSQLIRPEKVIVRLLADGSEVDSQATAGQGHDPWLFEFDEVPITNSQGQKIAYTVSIGEVQEYKTTVEDLTPSGEYSGNYIFRITCALDVDPKDKKPATINEVPEPNELTYNGSPRTLIRKGSGSGGTMVYAVADVGASAPKDGDFSAELPECTDAGVYNVWYYVKGDAVHTDTAKAYVQAKINKRPATITVANASKIEGRPDPTFIGTVGGLVAEGDLGEIKYMRTNDDEDVGTYKGVLDARYTENPNYDVSVAKGDFTIKTSTYDVKFNANVPTTASTTCSGTMDDEQFKYAEMKALSGNAYSLPGYNFNGWNTEADGTGTAFADEEMVQSLTFGGGTVTLYAQWSGKPYTIEYWSDDEGSQKHVQTGYFDWPSKLDKYSDEAFGWDSGGRTLHGWAGAGLGSFYEDGEDFCNLCGAPDANGDPANVALTAEWVNNGQIVVTVTRDGVPQGGLANSLSLTQGSTEFNIRVSDKDHAGTYVFDPTGITAGGNPAQLPEGEYVLRFEAPGYPPASADITYGEDRAANAVFDYYTIGLAKDPAYPDATEVSISGGEPVAGEPNTVIALDGSTLGLKTAVSEGYLFEGYTAVGVTPVWEGGDPSKAEQAIEVQGRADITAHVARQLTAVWLDGDGSVLQSKNYIEGDEPPAYDGETPTKAATAQYSYAFAGWDDGTVEGATTTYRPLFSETVNEYTVRFVDDDGTELQGDKVAYGQTPEYKGEEPAKAATAQYTYTFKGWEPEVAKVTGDATYKATYTQTINKHKVTFVDYDGKTVLKEAAEYDYGTPAADVARPADPTREADAQYTYKFAGWTPQVSDVTADAVYTAVYESSKRNYEVTWLQDDGALIDKTAVAYGEKPAHADPTKAATTQYTYAFKGWEPEISPVTGDATYKATYTQTVNEYTVRFVNDDGTELQGDKVAYGQTPEYKGETPRKAETDRYTYEFKGWTPDIAKVTGDATCTASFAEKAKPGVYVVISGWGSAWTEGSSAALAFTFKRTIDDDTTIDHFAGIQVDGKAVPEVDSSGKVNYTAKKGSVIVSLQPSFLATLAFGGHTLKATFNDGNAVEVPFSTVKNATPTPSPTPGSGGTTTGGSSPKTGDPFGGTAAALAVTAACALCLAAFALYQRRRRLSDRPGGRERR